METSRYRALLHAVDQGSLSKAAKAMDYTPSGVSQLVAALERDLGFPLLERTKKGVFPTNAGEALLPALRAVVSEEDRVLQLADELKGLSTGTVTIASYPSVASHWLPAVVMAFHKEFPDIRIQMNEGIHQEVDQWLQNKEADLGFISYDEGMPYEWIPLADDPMVAVLPLSHPLVQARAAVFPIEACNDVPFIMPGHGADVDTVALLSRHHVRPDVVFETIDNASTLAMVEQGMGISIVNSMICERMDFRIAKIPVEPRHAITLGIAVPSLESASPAAKHFIAFATERLRTAQE